LTTTDDQHHESQDNEHHHPATVSKALAAGKLYRRTLVVVAVIGALMLAAIAVTSGITVAYVIGISSRNHKQLIANAQANAAGQRVIEQLLAEPNNQSVQQRADLIALCKAIADCDVRALKFGKLPPVPNVQQIIGGHPPSPSPSPSPGNQGK
jgi:hypothetical protein